MAISIPCKCNYNREFNLRASVCVLCVLTPRNAAQRRATRKVNNGPRVILDDEDSAHVLLMEHYHRRARGWALPLRLESPTPLAVPNRLPQS